MLSITLCTLDPPILFRAIVFTSSPVFSRPPELSCIVIPAHIDVIRSAPLFIIVIPSDKQSTSIISPCVSVTFPYSIHHIQSTVAPLGRLWKSEVSTSQFCNTMSCAAGENSQPCTAPPILFISQSIQSSRFHKSKDHQAERSDSIQLKLLENINHAALASTLSISFTPAPHNKANTPPSITPPVNLPPKQASILPGHTVMLSVVMFSTNTPRKLLPTKSTALEIERMYVFKDSPTTLVYSITSWSISWFHDQYKMV